MKIAKLAFILVLFGPALLHAEQEKKYKLEECFLVTENTDGEKSYSVDIEVIDHFINRIATHAKEYPPRFENDMQKMQKERDLRALIDVLKIILEGRPDDPEILLRSGFAHSMGHNLDFEGSDQKAINMFKQLLEKHPNHPRGNYYYGMFLASTATKQRESLPYLEKAVELGFNDAIYTLGLVNISQGNNESGLQYLRKWVKLHPDDDRAKKIIEAVSNDRVRYHKE